MPHEEPTPPSLVSVTDSGAPKTYSSTFPPDPPPDLNDPAAIAQHDQRAFHSLDELLRHWDRPHRPSYHWLVPVGDDVGAIDLASRCQRKLPTEGLDPIPGPWIHLTVRRAGYEDEVSPAELSKLVAKTESEMSGTSRFKLQLIPLAGSPGAVRLSVAPWAPLMDLYQAVQVTGSPTAGPSAAEVFRPHVGVAYSAAEQPPGPIQQAVRTAAEGLASVEIEVDRISLVRMWRTAGWYEWTEVETVLLP